MSRPMQKRFSEEVESAAAAWVFRREAGLPPTEEAEFGRWRAADPRHESALARHEQAWSLLARPRRTGQAGFLLRRIVARASRRRRVAATCGAFLLALAVGAVWQIRRATDAGVLATRASVVTPLTQTLADGSVVELKTGAEIAVDFDGPLRRVLLQRGEAHFQVVKDMRPFVVTAGTVEFRAVGTGFSVQIASTQVELLVTEGRVAVGKAAERSPMDHPSAVPVPAPPGVLATVDAGNRMVVGLEATAPVERPVAVPLAEIAERLAWRETKLEFTATPLAEAVALMNRHNRVQLVIEDAELARLPISGLFRADRTEAFVRILEANFGVRAEQTDGSVRLRRVR